MKRLPGRAVRMENVFFVAFGIAQRLSRKIGVRNKVFHATKRFNVILYVYNNFS